MQEMTTYKIANCKAKIYHVTKQSNEVVEQSKHHISRKMPTITICNNSKYDREAKRSTNNN